jgi:hypothetical protein
VKGDGLKLTLACALGLLFVAPSHGAPKENLSAQDIVDRAVERAKWKDNENYEAKFRFKIRTQSEKLGKNGDVKEREERLYVNDPIDGVPYPRLVEKDGKPLTDKDLKKEGQREEKFRKRREKKGKDSPSDDDDRVAFDEDLVGRYDVDLEGVENANGRAAYVVSFKPKADRLPVKKRIDRALNKSFGKLWIDIETYEIAQLEFELQEKIRIWWGFIGSISEMRGHLEQEPVNGDEDVWLPRRFRIYMNGRILFKSLHRNENLQWSDFQKLSKQAFATGHR